MSETMSKAAAIAPDGAHAVIRADVGRFSPPYVAPSHVRALNAFYRRRRPFAATIAGRKATIATDWSAGSRLAPAWRCLTLTIDGEEGELYLPRSWLDILITALDRELSLDRLSPDCAAIVVEFALAENLEAIEAGLGCKLALASIGPPGDAPEDGEWPTLSFALTIEGLGAATCELRLPFRQALKVAEQLDRCAGTEQARVELPVSACLRVAATTLTLEEMRSLSPGDVVLVDEHCQPDGTAVAVIGGHLVAPVELTSAGGRLASAPTRGRGSSWEWSMDTSARDDSKNAAQEAFTLDDLPVRVVFEVGRLELALSEIGQLAPGSLLPLARPFDDAIDIVANGRRIGRGTIVRIGDSVGVRVTRLLDNV